MNNAKITATQLSLPKGGGAIQGIGETFQADEFTGTASLSFPVLTSPCRGFEPRLSIDYSSGSGNGIFGLGFGLSIPNVSRKTSKGLPRYDDTDTFMLSNAEDLVPIGGGERDEPPDKPRYRVATYRPRLEGLFAKIEHWIDRQAGDSHWRVISKENITSLFGTTGNTRIANPANPGHVLQWLLAETFDAMGNHIVYEYKSENSDNLLAALYEINHIQTANRYIHRITYGNAQPFVEGQETQTEWHFEVVFDYGEYNLDPANPTPYTPTQAWASRLDPFSTYYAGFEIRTHRLCRHILMFHRFEELGSEPVLVHATRFHYQESPVMTLLSAVEAIGYRYENGAYQTRSMPALDFKYTAFQPEGGTFEPLMEENGQPLPGLNLSPDYQLIDLYGEGIPGILYSDGRTTLYWEPEGERDGQGTKTARYASPQPLPSLPIDSNRQGITQRLIDITGNGQLELVVSTPAGTGYYEANPDHTWTKFRAFPAFPTDFYNPDNYLVDVTGDGLADILLLDGDRVRVYPSQGENGFGSSLVRGWESGVPLPRRGATNEVVLFADLFGSGMQHLVRITNGKVECWPNLGYGRFGKPVLLDNAPRFAAGLDASRLFLADLDGSGTADLVYIHPDRVQVFFNRSGNSFSEPLTIPLPSTWDQLDQIEFADIHGNGTTCLIFSENHPHPRHWCYDFSGQQKPYLLNEIDNNLGAKSTITYSSSTKFYLADKQQGRPWIVNLPFPVQVVERTESFDLISQTKLVSTYAYHHGYYDGAEREFRGFGLVERRDAETLSADAQPTDVPPVLMKTWYHTGAWLRDRPLSRQYEREYFRGDTGAHLLPDSVFDANQDSAPDVWREVFRSLKGSVLREEVYAPTAPAALPEQDQAAPYTVTETNYRVVLLQPKGQNKYGVYFVHPQETLRYEYERNPADPRVQHDFILKVDEYGNVLRSCTVTYGRRPAVRDVLPEQISLKVTAEEDSYINQTESGVHLLGIPEENKSYEINGLALKPGQAYFTFDEVRAYLDQVLGSPTPQLLNWQRHYYWSPEKKQPDSLGQVSRQALLARTEAAEFATQGIEQAFAGALEKDKLDALLAGEGGYRQGSDNPYWWNPGLTESYLEAARFFLPSATTDPYGNATTYMYDRYDLLPVAVTDALNNQVVVQALDYQTLAAQRIRDANGNLAEALLDPLRMLVVTSHYGTEEGQAVGFMQLKDYQQQPVPSVDDVIAHPQTYVQGAASYFYSDLFSWKERQVPVHTVSLTPEHYSADGTGSIQIRITYNDAFGRPQQSTTNVEPGQAHVVNSDGTITTATTSDRWLTSGRTVYNNKGNPVKQYEPYYIATYHYVDHPLLNQFGVSPTLFYDPLERAIRADTPKGFFSKAEFTPWVERRYDENDTIKDAPYYKANSDPERPDQDSPYYDPDLDQVGRQALQKAALFYNTSIEMVLDNLGRIVQDVRYKEDGTRLVTHHEWDIQGNQLASADPHLSAARKENLRATYSMNRVALKTVSADAGSRWQLRNVMGSPIYARDSRDVEITTHYDALHRPTIARVQGGDGATPLGQVVERMIYGDSLDESGKPVVAEPEKRNLRGQLYLRYDQAGIVLADGYTMLGQPIKTNRQLNQEYKQEANWNDITSITLGTLLQPTSYEATYQYDALSRVTAVTNPDGTVYQPTYHVSGRLNQIQVIPQPGAQPEIYVQRIDYDPKGQRQTIVYGNGVTTQYEYEPTTFRLARLLTTRSSDSKKLQDLAYTYDPGGNITHIVDAAQEPVFNANQQVRPESDYTYDALYQLIEATGREHPGLTPQNQQRGDFDGSWLAPLQPAGNAQALQNYTQRFSYDDAGNLYRIQHQGATPWIRSMTVSDSSNRAVDADLTDKPENVNAYFDGNGNQTRMAGMRGITWNYRDSIASVVVIERQDGLSDGEYYVYDSAGKRVRKVTERYGNDGAVARVEETIYLGALEIKRITRGGSVVEERHQLRVIDDERVVAIRIVWTQGAPPDGVMNPQIRYQLDNHLGSATLEVDPQGQIISYEEYFPYGGTSLVAGRSLSEVQLKQYRYSGKERDSVTGFYYYGARYYAPWLGRWMSPDPAGTVDGLNLYAFVGGNPINLVDKNGTNGDAPGKSSKTSLTKPLAGSRIFRTRSVTLAFSGAITTTPFLRRLFKRPSLLRIFGAIASGAFGLSKAPEVEEVARRHKARTAGFNPKSDNLYEATQARIAEKLSTNTTQDALQGYVNRFNPYLWGVPSFAAFETLFTVVRYFQTTTPEQRQQDAIAAAEDAAKRQLEAIESFPRKLTKAAKVTVSTGGAHLSGQQEQTVQMARDLQKNLEVKVAKQVSINLGVASILSAINHPAAIIATRFITYATLAHLGYGIAEFQEAIGGPQGPIVTALKKRLETDTPPTIGVSEESFFEER